MARNLKKVENETQTLFDMEYGEEYSKTWKMRHKHGLTQNIVRNTKKYGK